MVLLRETLYVTCHKTAYENIKKSDICTLESISSGQHPVSAYAMAVDMCHYLALSELVVAPQIGINDFGSTSNILCRVSVFYRFCRQNC